MPEIVLECNPDEALIKKLGYTHKIITHQTSKGEVINYLEKNPNTIGIVDEDPGSANPSYFSKFQYKENNKFGLDYLIIPKKGTRLIVIKPRLEEWILKQASVSKINLKIHSMPKTGRELHKIITRIPRFENMIDEMLQNNNEALLYLKRMIEKKSN